MLVLGAVPILSWVAYKIATQEKEYSQDEKQLIEDYRDWRNKQKHF